MDAKRLEMDIRANAKINLYLDVVGKRPDGYHNIETVFQEIGLYDKLAVKDIKDGFKLTCNIKELENDDNLLKKAFDGFCEITGKAGGIEVHLEKIVPFGAGLGGGSSDCAAFLSALNKSKEAKDDELVRLGTKLGADVPFFFYGGVCIGRGIGDVLEQIPSKMVFDLLIVNPGIHVSTKEAYAGVELGGGRTLKDLLTGLKEDDLEKVASSLYNGFEKSVFKKYPEIEVCKEKIKEIGALGALMSGSGSTCFGIFEDSDKAVEASFEFKKMGYYSVAVKSILR
jgi:4-diphosphocytidyl-2-C-methyl-D-erythritol kinase